MSVEQLSAELTRELEKLKAQVVDKENELSSLSKVTSKGISDYDEATKNMIAKIHAARDQQVNFNGKCINKVLPAT